MAIEILGFVVVAFLLGLLVYMMSLDGKTTEEEVTQSSEETLNQQFCPTCGNPGEPNSSFCLKCGHPLIEEKQGKKLCTDCHTEVDSTDKFCGGCGKSVGA